ncbi:hypothetical protein [Halomicrobium sp. LC1Hm]|uniref:hypothetical protein n=1 Tax=Halomicrobium sp. LC1Hm TaxID=2610902 RepID=UPI0012984343|nr:hypothetical protein [Halomicrobium sp. LC1Hm]QGA82760.1 hypothetical protein LC1Hm_1716 [Halomicrobium sp. LC1Hm]
MSTNPHRKTDRSQNRVADLVSTSVGRVTSTPSVDDDTPIHHVEVRNERYPEGKSAVVIPQAHGEGYLPPEGSTVLLTRIDRTTPVVVGPYYHAGSETPALEPGERVVSHPTSDARVKFHNDGAISIDGDEPVYINGGMRRPVVDVQTTTDADGHVIDITLERADNVYL